MRRHNGVAKALARAARQALNTKVFEDTFAHETFSAGARPDVAIQRGAPNRRSWSLLEVKVACPISSTDDGTGDAGTWAAFANTAAQLRRQIKGCPSIDGRPAVVAKYVDALSKGHAVTACIFEVFGGFDREVADLLLTWGSKARGKTPPGEEPPWSARNYVPYWSQIISKEVQRGAAREIVDRVREEANAREQARARGC